jgi:hypothetical protein
MLVMSREQRRAGDDEEAAFSYYSTLFYVNFLLALAIHLLI